MVGSRAHVSTMSRCLGVLHFLRAGPWKTHAVSRTSCFGQGTTESWITTCAWRNCAMVTASSSRRRRERGAVSKYSDGRCRGETVWPCSIAVLVVEASGATCTDTPSDAATGLMRASGSVIAARGFSSCPRGGTDAVWSVPYSRPSTATRESESPLREGRGTHVLFRIRGWSCRSFLAPWWRRALRRAERSTDRSYSGHRNMNAPCPVEPRDESQRSAFMSATNRIVMQPPVVD
jgi:hypothetical protein